ncbi:hypothetical protein [Cerasicoccus arenae]|uniref:Glycoside hydrolase family 38 N-terminal domain-containing protein n=1 Tax=Cerasicoccus arenae TaxID=424488 RepID=A0A8J3GE97_9BACT|nr:hypothetical protein [Cerasicoccus arenae]MBK1859269.1 hypothetical protein [Cerasicoccus arenae]GHC01600.1 hypothetical protein GCM10007047_17680 [Cerasicoccus arenae]
MPQKLDCTPERKWKVFLVHHSHTDIGYTQLQNRIARHHVSFLDQAIDISSQLSNDESLSGFKWTNECFWSIEQWLKQNDSSRMSKLVDCIQQGTIGLSATYLHFNELIDDDLMRASIERSAAFARIHELPLDTALSADINGFSWGYAQALADAGVTNFITSIHSHHGLAPLGKRQFPFLWETPSGQELLVWNGEHYQLGNALGLAPGAVITYGFTDELRPATRKMDCYDIAAVRLPRYLRQLERDGYPHDFVLLQATGAISDNAPPSAEIARFVNYWNLRNDDWIQVTMATPSEFCRHVREQVKEIPRLSGDWPDWWSDGLAANPNEVRLAREAMRIGHWSKKLAERKGITLSVSKSDRLEQNLLLFSEHTFNHSDSMSAPWGLISKGISGCKNATAAGAYEAAMDLQDYILEILGEKVNTSPSSTEKLVYKVINPFSEPVDDVASLYLEYRDFGELSTDPEICERDSGSVMGSSKCKAPRGYTFDIHVKLAANEEAEFELHAGTGSIRSLQRNFSEVGADYDVEGREASTSKCRVDHSGIETPLLRLDFAENGEITSLLDKSNGLELLNANRHHAPFTPVYEVTPVGENDGERMCDVRRSFGRNRKGKSVRRTAGVISDVCFPKATHIHILVEITYALEGVEWLKLFLKIWRNAPRIDVTVHMQKKCIWEPESLFLALPFSTPGGQFYLDKPGGPIRPWQDQLPDTLTDWFCLQNGYAICGSGYGLVVTMPDSPLLQLGPLDFGKRLLMGHPNLRIENVRPYAWLMNNYWETNFEANLGGFHEFNYRLEFGSHLAGSQEAIRRCQILNHGLKPFRINQ